MLTRNKCRDTLCRKVKTERVTTDFHTALVRQILAVWSHIANKMLFVRLNHPKKSKIFFTEIKLWMQFRKHFKRNTKTNAFNDETLPPFIEIDWLAEPPSFTTTITNFPSDTNADMYILLPRLYVASTRFAPGRMNLWKVSK